LKKDFFFKGRIAGCQRLTPGILATWEATIENIKVPKVRSYLQNNWSKKTEGVTQVIEHLPNKNEALSLNPSTTPPPKKKKKLRHSQINKV
jgi:hypothetical protein